MLEVKFFSKWETYTEPCPKLYVKRRSKMDISLLIALMSIFLLGIRLGRLDEQAKQKKLEQLEREKFCPCGRYWDDCVDCSH
jgi:hypothetical protein